MENLVDQLAPYQFLIAFSQIISRVCHHDDNVYATLEVAYITHLYSMIPFYLENYSYFIEAISSAFLMVDDSS